MTDWQKGEEPDSASTLGGIVDQVSAMLEAGQPVDPEVYGEQADAIRELLPTLEVVVQTRQFEWCQSPRLLGC